MAALVAGAVAALPTVAVADIQSTPWSTTAMTLQSGTNSNQVGFWQTLLCSNSQGVTVDGKFGNQTFNATKSFQTAIGASSSGVVGWVTWNKAENFIPPGNGGSPALQNLAGAYYSYYGGGNVVGLAKVNSKWKFLHSDGNYYLASNGLNMPSGSCTFI